MEVPQPNIPATPAVPDAPTTPAVPDPGTPGAPRSSRRCPSERSRRRRSTPILGRRPQRPRSGRGETDDSRGLTAGYAEAPMKTVADAMTTPPVVVATSTSVQEASSAMLQRRAQVAIVTRDGRVWGLVTAPDVARALADGLDATTTPRGRDRRGRSAAGTGAGAPCRGPSADAARVAWDRARRRARRRALGGTGRSRGVSDAPYGGRATSRRRGAAARA
jgi:CBS domain-containing protein